MNKPVEPAKAVKNAIDNALRPHYTVTAREIAFQEVWVWEEMPTFTNPYHTKITFHGNNRFQRGWALYEGAYGKWEINLAPTLGWATEDYCKAHPEYKPYLEPVSRTSGKARCIKASDEWKEPTTERVKKLTEQGIL